MTDERLSAALTAYTEAATPERTNGFGGVAAKAHRRRLRRRAVAATVGAAACAAVVVTLIALNGTPETRPSHAAVTTSATYSGATPGLQGVVWALQSVRDGGRDWTVAAGTATVAFSAERWAGNDGCNAHVGPVMYGPRSLSIDAETTVNTGAVCTGQQAQQLDTLYAVQLRGTLSVKISGVTMILEKNGLTATFVKDAGAKPARPGEIPDPGGRQHQPISSATNAAAHASGGP